MDFGQGQDAGRARIYLLQVSWYSEVVKFDVETRVRKGSCVRVLPGRDRSSDYRMLAQFRLGDNGQQDTSADRDPLDAVSRTAERGEAGMNPPYMCGDCLCRVCARNECGDNYSEGVDNDCLGCNGCSGTVDLLEDCPKEAFVPDEEAVKQDE